jgi:hypothetical protein
VVFQAGAGEPTRDVEFSLHHATLHNIVCDLPDRYTYNPKYVEFLSNAGLTDVDFTDQVSVAYFLRLAQQLVHAHVNLGLPQGDFSAVASTDVRVPNAVDATIRQFGEFSSATLGTRYLFRDYGQQVAHAVYSASCIRNRGKSSIGTVLKRAWLPLSASDKVTRTIIASHLSSFIADSGVRFNPGVLEDAVLSGEVPEFWEAVKRFLGDEPGEGEYDTRDRFDFLFQTYADVAQFTTGFSTARALRALEEIDLAWQNPQAGHMDWGFNVKASFSSLSDEWARKSAAYAQFFELSSGLANRSAACGSHAQLAEVVDLGGVIVVKAFIALAAPEFSLAACFPPTGVFLGGVVRNVVVTTSVNVGQRATEFVLLDWR